jgi:hypothetical protein
LKRARKKDEVFDDEPTVSFSYGKFFPLRYLSTTTPSQEEPSFPLVDIPDSEVHGLALGGLRLLSIEPSLLQLNDEQIKEKRKQRLAKAGYEARIRAKKEKEKGREAKEELERQEQLEREADPIAWVKRVRSEHTVNSLQTIAMKCPFSHKIIVIIGCYGANQGTQKAQSCSGRPEKRCVPSSNEEYRKPSR